jgi:RNA polymerase sigma-70 factor (ECF subfamily)
VDSDSLHQRLQAGDPAAFDEAYERFRPGLFRYLTRLCQSRELTEELLQEVWIRFADRARSLPAEIELGAWLFTVARNLYRSQRRRQVLSRRWLHELASTLGGRQRPESPFEALAASRMQRDLEVALAALPETYREVVLLVVIEHLTPGEAGHVLGVSPEATRQRLTRARRLLACALARSDAPETVGEST